MTIKDLMLRVAERGSLIQQSSAGTREAQTNADSADRLLRAVQDGIDEFCDARFWNWMRQRVKVTLSTDGTGPACIDGSTTRYLLPAGVANVPDTVNVLYADADSGRTGFAPVTDVMSVEMMLAQSSTQTGKPHRVAFAPIAINSDTPSMPRNSDGRGSIELTVFPAPDKNYVLTFECHMRPAKITDIEHPGYWPAAHDHTIIAYATLALLRSGDRPADSQALLNAQTEVQRRYLLSMEMDNALGPVVREFPTTSNVDRPTVLAYAADGTRLL